MSDIQRYEIQDDNELYMNDHGSLCLYDDHLACIQDANNLDRERIAELEDNPGEVEEYTRKLNAELKAQYHKDRERIAELESEVLEWQGKFMAAKVSNLVKGRGA